MSKYHAWLDNEGENKGSEIIIKNELLAAIEYLAMIDESEYLDAKVVFVRDDNRGVKEIPVHAIKSPANLRRHDFTMMAAK